MKKTYIKPEVYFEDFELSANIASGCGKPLNHAHVECYPTVPGIGTVFLTKEAGCDYTSPDDVGICYHNPTDESKLFTS